MPGDYLSDAAPLIYLMGKEDSVPATVRRKLSDPKSEVFYSHISIWDIQMKHQLGRLSMSDEPAVVLHRELAATASACAPGSFRPCFGRPGQADRLYPCFSRQGLLQVSGGGVFVR